MTRRDTPTVDAGLEIHAAELRTESVPAAQTVVFTWYDTARRWRGANFTVAITD
jgi:hypothetical protein